jgi:hypothetical protein
MKSKIKKFLNKPWTSMMVANNIKQNNSGLRSSRCRHYINSVSTVGSVVDMTQSWDATPQGYDYWCDIKHSNYHIEL